MARSNADLLAIKAEITNNPLALSGYFAITDETKDSANADAMNLVRVSLQIDREAIPVDEIKKAIDADEYMALSGPQRQWLDLVLAEGTVNPKAGGEVREGLLQLFGAGTESRTNLQALLTTSSNRVEHMFKNGLLQAGGTVTPSDISQARAAT